MSTQRQTARLALLLVVLHVNTLSLSRLIIKQIHTESAFSCRIGSSHAPLPHPPYPCRIADEPSSRSATAEAVEDVLNLLVEQRVYSPMFEQRVPSSRRCLIQFNGLQSQILVRKVFQLFGRSSEEDVDQRSSSSSARQNPTLNRGQTKTTSQFPMINQAGFRVVEWWRSVSSN